MFSRGREDRNSSAADNNEVDRRYVWCGVCCLVILVIAAGLIGASLQKLKSTEYGLEYDVYAKKLDEAAKTGGLHLGPPGFEFIKFPSTFVGQDLEAQTCVSKDGLRVGFSVSFQYQMPAEWIVPAVVKYRDFHGWARIVRSAGNSAIHHSCSAFQVSEFQKQRGVIQSTMEDNLRLKLEGPAGDGFGGVYARAISLQLKELVLPDDYQSAVAEKQEAEEDITLAKNQRTQETTKARTQLLAAKEEARKIFDTANNDANVTLTEALLQAEETAFAFETEATVLVGVKQSLGLTVSGMLSFMANQLYASVPNLRVSAGEPARISRKDEL